MTVEIMRTDKSACDLRCAAAACRDAKAARRMLAIALILDGTDRKTAAENCGMDRQTLRDWVHRYNDAGIEGLSNRRSPGRSRQVPMPCSSSTVQAGTDQQNWKCQTTSPCSNSRPIRRNSTRWKTFGPTCAPTSWQSLCLKLTMRLSTNAAMPGISSQRTNRQSHQLHHVIGPKQSINRAVGIIHCPASE